MHSFYILVIVVKLSGVLGHKTQSLVLGKETTFHMTPSSKRFTPTISFFPPITKIKNTHTHKDKTLDS
jgi:hypothetical protein